MTPLEIRLWVAAVASWTACALLGYRILHGPPAFVDQLGPWLFGRATAFAAFLTWTGYGTFITLVAVVLAVMSLAMSRPLAPVIVLVALQLVSQGAVTMVKLAFYRPRPDRWLVREDLGFSYPSGHASTAIVFYGALLLAVALGGGLAPLKIAGVAGLAFWIAGICWSRVALGAHYPSDVVGGALIGFGFLCAGTAVVHHVHGPFPA
jgi:undecaprenyl-diphosphatase